MSDCKRTLKIHVEFKSGGDFDFSDAIRIGFNNEQKVVIDFSKDTRYSEDFDKIKRIIIMAEVTRIIIVPSKKHPRSRFYAIEVEHKGIKKSHEKGQSEDKKEL